MWAVEGLNGSSHELVAQLLNNGAVAQRVYLSPRTVESHFSRVFAKLGVSGRGELIAAIARRPPT